jgi:hypothetical protein
LSSRSSACLLGLVMVFLLLRTDLASGRILCFRGNQCCAARIAGSSDGIDAAYMRCGLGAAWRTDGCAPAVMTAGGIVVATGRRVKRVKRVKEGAGQVR